MSTEDNEGISYLKALRQTGGASAAAAAPAGDHVSEATSSTSQPIGVAERRRTPRYKCEGSVEMRQEGREVHTWASFKDVSLHGCYVEATATYPVGTVLHLKLEANGFQVLAKGVVRVTYPFLGMGIALTEMTDDDRTRLKELLRTISRPAIVMGAAPLAPVLVEPAPLIADPTAALRALLEFFEKHQILPREEFLRVVRQSQEAPKSKA
jgi:hypothetical protein